MPINSLILRTSVKNWIDSTARHAHVLDTEAQGARGQQSHSHKLKSDPVRSRHRKPHCTRRSSCARHPSSMTASWVRPVLTRAVPNHDREGVLPALAAVSTFGLGLSADLIS